MKLLRLKITDPEGFRSLQPGFEYHFRTPWRLQEEQGFAPFVCAGRNGSGKSNLLEALAAIFFQLDVLRVGRNFLPDNFPQNDEARPNGFEIDYLIAVPKEFARPDSPPFAQVRIVKQPDQSPEISWLNQGEFESDTSGFITERERDFLLPQYVLGYSSGENEILSLPFFKMRFIQFDEYWEALTNFLPYPGRPETRLTYLDSGFSQAILLSNLLLQDADTLKPFRDDVGVEALKEFRIILRRSIPIDESRVWAFGSQDENARETLENILDKNPEVFAVESEGGEKQYRVNLMALLEGDERSDRIVSRLKRCATCSYVDPVTDTLYLDYCVNDATREAFRENFDYEITGSPITLFQAFQVLLTLNLYSVSERLKTDLYQSDSLYVSETVPTLASDERIMRFKHFWLTKRGIKEPVLLKSLSDGEHQFLHSLGLCLLFRNTNSLFLLDEPETHFNPDWRANFIIRLHECFAGSEGLREMLITTHSPFLISDSRRDKVLVFKKDDETGTVEISNPEYNTLGASINKITMTTFHKRETIGGHAQALLDEFRERSENQDEDKDQLITEIDRQLGDSVEKVLLIKTILDGRG